MPFCKPFINEWRESSQILYRNFDNFMLAKPIIPSSGIRAGKKAK